MDGQEGGGYSENTLLYSKLANIPQSVLLKTIFEEKIFCDLLDDRQRRGWDQVL